MKGFGWFVVAVLAVASLDLLESAHGEGLPLATGGQVFPASLGSFGMWTVAGGIAVWALVAALRAWGVESRLARILEERSTAAVAMASVVAGLSAGCLAYFVGDVDLTADDSVRRTLAWLSTEGAVSQPVLGKASSWMRPAVVVIGDAVVPTTTLASAVLLLPGLAVGVPALASILAHAVTVPAVARLVERGTSPSAGALAAWLWALLPAALLPAATALPHAPALALLAWAAVFVRTRPRVAAVLVAGALLLRPAGALVPALVLASWHPVVAGGAGIGLGLAGLIAGLQTGWPVSDAVFEGWRVVALPVLAAVVVQAAAGWPMGFLPALFSVDQQATADQRGWWRRWAAMALGTLLLAGVAPALGPDWVGPLRVHEAILPLFVLSWMGGHRLARSAGRPQALLVAALAVGLVTTGGWSRHRAVSMVAAADDLRLPEPPKHPALVFATGEGRVGPCRKQPARAEVPVPFTLRDGDVWMADPGGSERSRIAGALGGPRVFTLSWNRRKCRSQLRPGAPK